MKRRGSTCEFAVLAIIVSVAVFFRTFRLDTVPGGMTDDEAIWGLRASQVAEGEARPILFVDHRPGGEPMFAYLVAVFFNLLGSSILVARALTALVGIVTVPMFYLLLRELTPQRTLQGSLPLIAVVATSWLATSYWHVIYSRYAVENALLPLLSVSTFLFLWRAINSRRWVYFGGAGFLLGASIYTYQAARLLPVVVIVFSVYLAWQAPSFMRSTWLKIALLLGISFLVVAPLASSALRHPHAYLGRAREASIFNTELNQGNPIKALATGVVKAAAMFGLEGDPAPERNPGDRALLDPLTSICFLVGLGIAVTKTREKEYAFLWLWFLLMCLPAALTILEIPNFNRAIGALPPLYVFPALAVVEAQRYAHKHLPSPKLRATSASFIFGLPLLFAAATTYRDYFGAWADRDDLHRQFDVTLIEAAKVMNETDATGAVWIWPTTSLVTGQHIFSHPEFLYHGDAPYFFLSCDDDAAALDLTRLCQHASKGLVIEWKEYVPEKAYEAIAADPKGLISFLFHKYGREVDRTSYEAFDVVTYEVPEPPAFSIADKLEPLTVDFGGELMLIGMDFGGSSLEHTSTPQEVERRELPSGKSGWVVLRWRALTEPSRNYKVSVHLQDERGRVAGQVDKLLLSNHLHPTQDWQTGQEEIDYYTLPSWPATAPGQYVVGVTLYDAETLQVAPIAGIGQSYALGVMKIVRPLVAADVHPQTTLEKDRGDLAPGIRLLGYDFPRREANPGEELSVVLYWQALEDINRDYLIAVRLTDDRGDTKAETLGAPVYGTYRTSQWTEGEALKDWHDVSLPRDLPQGDYQVLLRILEEEQLLGQAALGPFEVHGRARMFSMPDIQHPLEATLGEAVRFLGYDLSSTNLQPGKPFRLTLYWQAIEEMQTSYTVFAHLLDAGNQIRGQMDSIPAAGEAPTTSWVEGEIVTEEYGIVVDTNAPPGLYAIEIGMYDATTGRRLPTYDAQGEHQGDRILLQATPVLVVE